MKHALKTVGGLNPEMVPSSFSLPDLILEALESLQGKLPPEEDELNLDLLTKDIVWNMMRRKFGKWLPKGAQSVIEGSLKELRAIGEERGYPLSHDEVVASYAWSAQRILELEKWKEEQRVIRRATQALVRQETTKQLVDGRKVWVDATVYELPPLVQPDGKSLKHALSRYACRLPDGRTVDLGMQDGNWAPIMSDGPDIAMQRIAKRLGMDIRGGAHTILQALTGQNDIIPAYQTIWHRGQWFTIVGWQKDPKLTNSSYYLDGTQLTRIGDDENRLTMSELDYHLLRGSAETEVQDEQGEVVDYLNEEEEFYAEDDTRDEDPLDPPLDPEMFDEGSDEVALIWFAGEQSNCTVKARYNRKGQRRMFTVSVGTTKPATMNEVCSESTMRALVEQHNYHSRLEGLAQHHGNVEMEAVHAAKRRQLERMAQIRDEWMQPQSTCLVRHWLPEHKNGFGSMRGTVSGSPLMEPVRTSPEMLLVPANEVASVGPILEVAELGEHRVSVMHRVRRSTIAVVGFDVSTGTPIRKAIAPRSQPRFEAKDASPRLKETLRRIICTELEKGTLEQEVSDTFAAALDEAIRAACA
jgi:hypothetical protein